MSYPKWSTASANNATIEDDPDGGGGTYTLADTQSIQDLPGNLQKLVADAAGLAQALIGVTVSGTDTYTCTVPTIHDLDDDFLFVGRFTNANTANITINVNSLGAKSGRDNQGNLITSGQIGAGSIHWVHYFQADDQFRLMNVA